MKVLLTAINAKYIHSNLAVYSLKAYAGDPAVEIGEYTINQQKDDILMDIYKRQPDILCLSCYIWNLDYIEEIVLEIGKLRPDMPIWLGGPEVSYDAKEVLRRLPCVKGVMKGEGEKTFKEICRIYRNEFEKRENVCGYQDKNVDNSWKKSESVDNQLKGVDGITFREEKEKIIDNPWRPIMDLSEVPFVYDHMEDFEHKIIYYETSRGCPFSCSYCLSSVDKRLRFRNIELVKKELQFFLDHKVPQVKFVDRTFNCKHDHSIAIWKYIMEHDNGITNFHFEIAADILNEEEMELLEQMRPGLVQLEIGVQSTNDKTIKAIDRKTDFEMIKRAVKLVQKAGGVHMHLDLIVGLPFEDFNSFGKSFDDVFNLRPDVLQLGFLKLLRGTKIRSEEEKYGYRYNSKPPYEVLKNDFISYEDVLLLKGIEEVFERYYNSGVFKGAMEYLLEKYNSPFEMFKKLWLFYDGNGYNKVGQSRNSLYEILSHFCDDELFCDILKLDYFTYNKGVNSPKWSLTKYDRSILKTRFDILTDEFIAENLSEYADIPTKETVKYLQFETFEYDVLSNCEKRRNIIIFDNKYNRRIRVCKDLKQ